MAARIVAELDALLGVAPHATGRRAQAALHRHPARVLHELSDRTLLASAAPARARQAWQRRRRGRAGGRAGGRLLPRGRPQGLARTAGGRRRRRARNATVARDTLYSAATHRPLFGEDDARAADLAGSARSTRCRACRSSPRWTPRRPRLLERARALQPDRRRPPGARRRVRPPAGARRRWRSAHAARGVHVRARARGPTARPTTPCERALLTRPHEAFPTAARGRFCAATRAERTRRRRGGSPTPAPPSACCTRGTASCRARARAAAAARCAPCTRCSTRGVDPYRPVRRLRTRLRALAKAVCARERREGVGGAPYPRPTAHAAPFSRAAARRWSPTLGGPVRAAATCARCGCLARACCSARGDDDARYGCGRPIASRRSARTRARGARGAELSDGGRAGSASAAPCRARRLCAPDRARPSVGGAACDGRRAGVLTRAARAGNRIVAVAATRASSPTWCAALARDVRAWPWALRLLDATAPRGGRRVPSSPTRSWRAATTPTLARRRRARAAQLPACLPSRSSRRSRATRSRSTRRRSAAARPTTTRRVSPAVMGGGLGEELRRDGVRWRVVDDADARCARTSATTWRAASTRANSICQNSGPRSGCVATRPYIDRRRARERGARARAARRGAVRCLRRSSRRAFRVADAPRPLRARGRRRLLPPRRRGGPG